MRPHQQLLRNSEFAARWASRWPVLSFTTNVVRQDIIRSKNESLEELRLDGRECLRFRYRRRIHCQAVIRPDPGRVGVERR